MLNRTVLTLLGLGVIFGSYAQVKTDSPYSRFGIGDLVDQNFAPLRAMGGISAAFSDPYLTNLANPASLAMLKATSFEVGFDALNSQLSNGDQKESLWTGNLNYFSLAFPLINPVNRLLDRKSEDFNWGMSFALTPNSRVGYFTSIEEDLPQIGNIVREYGGDGGTNRFSFGNGVQYKQWRFGLNMGYLFGTIEEERAVLFQEIVLASNNYQATNASYRGFFWNAGIQYEIDLSTGKGKEDARTAQSLTLGLTGHSRWNFRTVSDNISTLKDITYKGLNDEFPDEITDTLSFSKGQENQGKMPGSISFGAVYKHSTKWILGANFSSSAWSKYENGLKSEEGSNLDNAFQVSLGAQYVPDASSYRYFYRRISYRAGINFGTDPRTFQGEQIKNFTLNVGFGLPIVLSRQLSFINLGVAYGRYAGNIPVKTNFVRFNVGVTLNNNLWFYKRKFN
ncbi:MAG: hypothetical protein HKN87_05060 [Saprospiraceae bacterium]|nr:hypothetical protein [Saprospiraceae bacterium]